MRPTHMLLFIVILAACLTQLAADLYLPSIPAIALDMDTSLRYVQWTMVSYIFGAAISQLFYGPLSEGIGRKIPIMMGMAIMLIGSVLSWFASDINMLVFSRFIQGTGAGACAALWRSVTRDVLSGAQLAKYGAYLSIIITFIVPAAPALGGYLHVNFGWKSNFTFMMFYSIVALILLGFGYTETSVNHSTEKLKFAYVKKTFKMLLINPVFMGVTACTFLSYGALFATITLSPIFLIHHLEIDPVQYGWLSFVGTGSAYILSSWINGRWVERFGMANMMRFGMGVMMVASIMLMISNHLVGMNIWTVALPIFVFYFGVTFIWSNAFALAFTPFGHIAGYAGALYGFMQICGGAAICGIASFLPDSSTQFLALLIMGCTLSAWIILEKVVLQVSAANAV